MDSTSVASKEEWHVPTGRTNRIDRDALAPILSEYETFIAALQQQIENYKVEHEYLKDELTQVIEENRHLSDRLKNVLGKKLSDEEVLYPCQKKESDMVKNLQQQVSAIIQEKDSAIELWHMAQQELDAISKYEDNRHVNSRKMEDMKKDFSGAMTLLEAKLNSVRSTLAKERVERENIEQKYCTIAEENESLKTSLKSRQEELGEALEGQCSLARELQEVEKRVAEQKKEVEKMKKTENDLESALSQCHKQIEDLISKNAEAQDKVSESLQLVEIALAEKESALIAESKIREQNHQFQQTLTGIIEEADIRIKEEVENVKHQYNGRLKTLLLDIKRLENECHERDKKLRKEAQEKNTLEDQLEQIQKEAPSTVNLMEKRLNMVHGELSDARNSNLQLVMEKESLHSEIGRLQESHAEELRRLVHDHHVMEQRMTVMQTQLEVSRSEIEKLLNQIRFLEQQTDRTNLLSKIDLQEWQQKQFHQKEFENLVAQLHKIQKHSEETASELEHHLAKQQSIKSKYQKAMKTLTEKFEKRVHELRHESNMLKRENKALGAKLNDIQKTLAAQKHLSKEDNK